MDAEGRRSVDVLKKDGRASVSTLPRMKGVMGCVCDTHSATENSRNRVDNEPGTGGWASDML